MTVTAAVLGEIHKLAKAHLLAKSAFNRAYSNFWQTEVKPCSDEMGWKLLVAFRGEVEKYRFKLNRNEQATKIAAWEIFRLELVGAADYSFEDVVGFVKWYGGLKSKISQAVGHLYEFHGDSFGDLVDSYPLAGREVVERALASHPKSDRPRREGYRDDQAVTTAVLETLGSQWYGLICERGNYVMSALEAACRRCFLYRILTGLDEQITWTEDEMSVLNFAGRYDD